MSNSGVRKSRPTSFAYLTYAQARFNHDFSCLFSFPLIFSLLCFEDTSQVRLPTWLLGVPLKGSVANLAVPFYPWMQVRYVVYTTI